MIKLAAHSKVPHIYVTYSSERVSLRSGGT